MFFYLEKHMITMPIQNTLKGLDKNLIKMRLNKEKHINYYI